MESGIVGGVKCVTLNILWKVLTTDGQWYCRFNVV